MCHWCYILLGHPRVSHAPALMCSNGDRQLQKKIGSEDSLCSGPNQDAGSQQESHEFHEEIQASISLATLQGRQIPLTGCLNRFLFLWMLTINNSATYSRKQVASEQLEKTRRLQSYKYVPTSKKKYVKSDNGYHWVIHSGSKGLLALSLKFLFL